MNKAFTANINDQVTARGYLDENNQLIMLEPEGSGGGEYSPASVTIRPVEDSSVVPTFAVNGVFIDDGVAGSASVAPEKSTLEVASLTNSAINFSDADGYEFTAVSGAESMEADVPVFRITGNAVITYRRV